ncbi:MAG: gamma-glutamylcyclotransferase family protein, partial [Acidiferrobacterales bacterium]|nr:gamma-glutamylcyclotransferase family protein [Acidiferrobacterales bacterium]
MHQRLFVYGTLLREDILCKVIGFLPASEPATLNGYRRMRMGDKPWPVILPALTSQVDGRVLTGLN